MQIISMIRHRDKAPTNALVAQAVRSCAERGIAYLWYANFSYGKKQPDSLADFKRHNGFQKVELPRYYIPLTFAGGLPSGWDCTTAALIGFLSRLPLHYRKIRASWYARRFPGFENA